jgi:hypothetical protein
MFRPRLFALAALASITIAGAPASPAEPPPAEKITITIDATPRQTFAGFGFGLNGPILSTHPRGAEVQGLLYQGLDARFLRLWYRTGPGGETANQRFIRDYVESGIIADARRRGVEKLLLAPTGMARELRLERFAAYADFILELRDRHGVKIDATGLQNEPNPQTWTPAATAEAVLAFRRELDARDLRDVQLVPIDASNMDATWAARIRGVQDQPEAWAAIGGISGHSYTMAATPEWAALTETKPFWQTEAGWVGPVHMTAATRILSDLNHRVTHWLWFIGAHSHETRGNQNQHRLIYFNPDGHTYTVTPTYHILRQLSQTFPVGSVFRGATSDRRLPNAHMGWSTPARKPAVIASAALAPDGTWRIAVNNMSYGEGSRAYHDARSYEVTIRVDELAHVPELAFTAMRTRETEDRELAETAAPIGVVKLRRGELLLTLAPHELVTLISSP